MIEHKQNNMMYREHRELKKTTYSTWNTKLWERTDTQINNLIVVRVSLSQDVMQPPPPVSQTHV